MLKHIIIKALNWLPLEDLMEVGRTTKIIGAEKHGTYFPWIIWSREDFTPEGLVTGVYEHNFERVMDQAWGDVLKDRRFTELADADWDRIHNAIFSAVDTLETDEDHEE